MTVDDLPLALTTEQAAELLCVSPDLLWKLAREGTAPVQPLRLGRALRWPRNALLELLAIPVRDDAEPPEELGAAVVPFDPRQRTSDERTPVPAT